MLKVDCARWNQSRELLREEALAAEHPRDQRKADGIILSLFYAANC